MNRYPRTTKPAPPGRDDPPGPPPAEGYPRNDPAAWNARLAGFNRRAAARVTPPDPEPAPARFEIDVPAWHARLAGHNQPTTPIAGRGAAGARPPAPPVPVGLALAAD